MSYTVEGQIDGHSATVTWNDGETTGDRWAAKCIRIAPDSETSPPHAVGDTKGLGLESG